jgi:hypothetical protein
MAVKSPLRGLDDGSSAAWFSTLAGPVFASYAAGAFVTLGLALFLVDIPIQLSDSFLHILTLSDSWWTIVVREFTQPAYLRPFRWLEMKAIYDLSDGEYFLWFRATHVVQVVLLVGLYLHLIKSRTWRDAALVPLGLAVLVGHHTFVGTVSEAFPVNHFMTVLLCCFLAAALSLREYRQWQDPVAIVLFWVAALTVESGLLVGVIFVGARLIGARGVSRAGVVAVAGSVLAYFALRSLILDTGTPSLGESSSGYGFSMFGPDELEARFGERPLPLYIYNVVASILSVLFGEPQAGVFWLTYGLSLGSPYPATTVAVIASTSATLLIGMFVRQRFTAWRRRELSRDDQLVLLFLIVLVANATMCYAYAKNVIMSPAGGFFALATFVSARLVVPDFERLKRRRLALLLVLCVVLSASWSVRLLSVHVHLWVAARDQRDQWAYVQDWVELQQLDSSDANAAKLLETLRTDALLRRAPARELDWARRTLFY